MKRLLLPALIAALPTVTLGQWFITDFNAPGYELLDNTNDGSALTDTDTGPIVGVANYFPPTYPVNYLVNRVASISKTSGGVTRAVNLDNLDGNLYWDNASDLFSVASVTYTYNTPLNFNSLGDRISLSHLSSDGVNFTLEFNVNGGSGSGGATISNNYATMLGAPLERSWLYSSAAGNLAAFDAVTSFQMRLVSLSGGADNVFDNLRLTGVAAVPEPGTTAAVVAVLLGAGVHGYRRVRAVRK